VLFEPAVFFHRRKLAEEQCSQATSYPDPDPLVGQTEFYGQRPWRPSRIDPVDMQREREGILALQYKERTFLHHSRRIIDLQAAALRQFDLFGSPRTKTQVLVQMAEELMIDQQYEPALATLLPCIQVYRTEQWTGLAAAALLKALKCAFLTMQVESYLGLCLELSAGPACPEAERARIRQNLYLVLEGKAPLPEPSLTGKSERAAVGEASRLWADVLAAQAGSVTVDMSDFSSLLEVSMLLPPVAKVGEPLTLVLSLRNHAPDKDFAVSEVWCGLSVPAHEAACRSAGRLTLPAGGAEVRLEFILRPSNAEVGTVLSVLAVSLQLELASKIILVKKFPVAPPTIAAPLSGEIKKASMPRSSNCISIITRDSNVEVRFLGQEPVLVGEWFPLRLELVNRETGPVTDIEVTYSTCHRY